MAKVISTYNAPTPTGAYSQGVEENGFIYISGQLGIDVKSGVIGADVTTQAIQAIKNIEKILESAGCNLNSLVKTTVYVKNPVDLETVDKIYSQYFTVTKPARSMFAVLDLPKSALVMIDAVAYKNPTPRY